MLTTHHRVILSDSRHLEPIEDESVSLVVTSPPYPMIAMWDSLFTELDSEVGALIEQGEAVEAFHRMHAALRPCWEECARVLRPGGLLIINIGDATRKLGDSFQLFENHAMILNQAREIGLQVLPDILWRKPNNSPTKFLGSGMLPPGAYVTYEHEYVLILRKGGPRRFSAKERVTRRESAYFWEERNQWFSDLWSGLPGVEQEFQEDERPARKRSAAFPLELAWRLIQMFSCHGDTVLDPFLGTGTTMVAAMMSGRNSLGVERDASLGPAIQTRLERAIKLGRERTRLRLTDHRSFVEERTRRERSPKYAHEGLDTRVITAQETDLKLWMPSQMESTGFQSWKLDLDPLRPDED
jgi:DNA modification methylase